MERMPKLHIHATHPTATASTTAAAETPTDYLTEVLIVGSGPAGATYVRKLVEKGIKVIMVEVGAQ